MRRLIALGLCLAATTVAPAELMRGHYVHGSQVSFFEPCGGGEALWVLLEGDPARWLVRARDEITTIAYERVFAELRGTRTENRNQVGVPDEYDALLALETVYEVRLPGPGDCP